MLQPGDAGIGVFRSAGNYLSATPRITSLSTLAALLAIGAAAITGVVLAERAFSMSLDLPWPTLLGGGAFGMLLAMSAGWLGTRRIVSTPPGEALRAGG